MITLHRWLLALAAVGALAAAAPPARAAYLESASAGGMCLDFSTGQGQIKRCNGSAGQDIALPNRGSGQLRVGRSCVAAAGKSEALYITQCKNRNEQNWYLDQNGALVNGGGLCADIDGSKKKDGTRVVAFRCHGGDNQRWNVSQGPRGDRDPPPGPGHHGRGDYQTSLLTPQHAPGMCLDVAGGRSELIIFGCSGNANQLFSYTTYGETELQVGGNCVTAPNDIRQSLYVARCTGSYQQRWGFAQDGTLRSASGHCADVEGSKSRERTKVILFKCSAGPNQRWDAIRR